MQSQEAAHRTLFFLPATRRQESKKPYGVQNPNLVVQRESLKYEPHKVRDGPLARKSVTFHISVRISDKINWRSVLWLTVWERMQSITVGRHGRKNLRPQDTLHLQPGSRDRGLLALRSLSVFPSFTRSSSTPAHRVVLPMFTSGLLSYLKHSHGHAQVSPLGEQTPEINNHTSQRRVRWCVSKQWAEAWAQGA